ncbi:A24 family peptidase [Photobacterium ganghwense]|uniref:A24 family peptidase n=1 Tax=Photobacterium sp. GSS17 TaxID=3020715 RepID=UPI001C2DAC39|nr:A24 family peptidase [Photobacterium ganghwense]
MSDYSLEWWLLLATISIYICYQDVLRRIISNRSCCAVFAVCSVLCFLTDNYAATVYIVPIFLIGFVLFILKAIAAGDVKLFAAFSVAISPEYLLLTVVSILIFGGMVGCTQWFLEKNCRSIKSQYGVPYGVPICIGSLLGIAASI